MAKACQVSGNLDSGLTESELLDESETEFTEEQELDQLINGELCFKVYPFSGGKIFGRKVKLAFVAVIKLLCILAEAYGSEKDRKIILSGSFNPLHEGHLKLLEAAMR